MVHKCMVWSEKSNNALGRKIVTQGIYYKIDMAWIKIKVLKWCRGASSIWAPCSLSDTFTLSMPFFPGLQHEGSKARNVPVLTLDESTVKSKMCSKYYNSNDSGYLWELRLFG